MKATFVCGSPPPITASMETKVNWLLRFAGEVIRNAKIDALTIADGYTVSGLHSPPVRTINASTATVAEVGDVLAQFLADLKTRGPNAGN